jgi:membrane protein
MLWFLRRGNGLKPWYTRLRTTLGRLVGFVVRVLRRFFGPSNGLLLSGAVAYNTLLSIVPLFAVLLVTLSLFINEQQLMSTIGVELRLILPGQADAVLDALRSFMAARELIGIVGFAVLLFFSSIAFRILENAVAVIFGPHPSEKKRSFWVSAALPYAFIALMGLGIIALTAMTALLDALADDTYYIPMVDLTLGFSRASSQLFYLAGLVGLTLVFSAIYKVLPTHKIRLRLALVGGLTAAVLWEIVRYVLVWYFTTISLVNVVYGSLATVIIVLLTLEIGSVIILLGAQVIAELERNALLDLRWYEDPDAHPTHRPPSLAPGTEPPYPPSSDESDSTRHGVPEA